MSRGRIIRLAAAGALLAALVFLAMGGALACGFVRFDDHAYVFENPLVQAGLTKVGLRWAFTSVYQQWWLPLLWLSYMADSEVFGTGPMGYHLTNLLLHVANVWLLGWVLWRLTGSGWRSLAVAALFAVHPLRVESVVWITERKDMLSGLFFFLALLAYVRHAVRPGARNLALVAGCMLLGLMAKPTVIMLPVWLLLLDYWPLGRGGLPWKSGERRRWLRLVEEKIPLFVLAGVFAWINLHTHTNGIGAPPEPPGLVRLGLMPGNVWTYLRLVFWPAGLAIYYPENDVVRAGPLLAGLAGLGAITGAALAQARRRPYLLVGWLWFLAGLLPILRGLRLGLAAYADRFTYLPAIGLAVTLVWGAAEWAATPGRRRMLAVLAAVGMAGMVVMSRRQTRVWRDSETLFRQAIAVTEGNAVMHFNLANYFVREGRMREAGEEYGATLALKPDYVPAMNNQAWALATDPAATPEEIQEALRLARRAIEVTGSAPASLLNTLERAQTAAGDHRGALESARSALALAEQEGREEACEKIRCRIRIYEAEIAKDR